MYIKTWTKITEIQISFSFADGGFLKEANKRKQTQKSTEKKWQKTNFVEAVWTEPLLAIASLKV